MYSAVEEMFAVLSELLSTPGSLKDLPGHDGNQPTTFQPSDRLAQLVELGMGDTSFFKSIRYDTDTDTIPRIFSGIDTKFRYR